MNKSYNSVFKPVVGLIKAITDFFKNIRDVTVEKIKLGWGVFMTVFAFGGFVMISILQKEPATTYAMLVVSLLAIGIVWVALMVIQHYVKRLRP